MTNAQHDYQAYFDSVSAPCAVLDADLCFVEVNAAYCQTVMRDRQQLLGQHIWEAFPESPERQARQNEVFQKALNGVSSTVTNILYAISIPEEEGGGSREIWWTIHTTPVPGTDGRPPLFVLRVEDVTPEMRARELADAIAGEFQHRVGNLFSIVMTIARQTAQNSSDTSEFMDRFGARITSLSRTHMALTGQDWDSMSLKRLVDQELAAYRDQDARKIQIDGHDLRLSAMEAQALSMALHELATNAAKYGAFKHPDGCLHVSWKPAGDGGYEFEWRESALIDIRAPEKTGFGSMMLTSILPSQLNGEAIREFCDTGHVYRLHVAERQATA